MTLNYTPLTIAGQLTTTPTLRYTAAGTAVTNIRIAHNPARWNNDDNTWHALDPLFITATAWGATAENIAASLHRGDRILATGRIRSHTWTNDGTSTTEWQLDIIEIGASLAFATTTITRTHTTTPEDTTEHTTPTPQDLGPWEPPPTHWAPGPIDTTNPPF